MNHVIRMSMPVRKVKAIMELKWYKEEIKGVKGNVNPLQIMSEKCAKKI